MRVRYLGVFVFLGTIGLRVHRSRLFSLMGMEDSLRSVGRYHRRYYQLFSMFSIVSPAQRSSEGVVIVRR